MAQATAIRLKKQSVLSKKKLKYEFKTDVFRAFTSGMIIKKLRERDGIEIDTVDEALEKLYKSGYTDIFCVPTHIMCGIEYDKACRMIEKFNDKMKIRISRPLVTETSDYYNIVDIFKHRLTDKTDFTFLWDTAATILRMPPTLPLIITLKMPI